MLQGARNLGFLKYRDRQDLKRSVERGVQLKFFLNNGYEHEGGHAAPDLRLDCVLAVAQKLLDTKVLFDPFEEQLHLPAAFVESGNCQGRQGGVVGQEDQRLLGCWVLEPDTAQV